MFMTAPERRPIAARNWRVSQKFADWLAKRNVSPNAISLFGMFVAILGGASLAATRINGFAVAGFLIGAATMQIRLLCNMFDGMVAISQNRASRVGELFNEIPDRVSDAAFFIGAGYAVGGDAVLGFIAACLAIFVAYVRVAGRVAGAHHEYCGPMAKPQRMAILTVAAVMANSPFSTRTPEFAELFPGRGVMAWTLVLVIVGEIVTVIRRLKKITAALRSLPNV